MSLKGVKNIGYLRWQERKAGVPVTKISVARKLRGCYKANPAIARRTMAIQAGHYGQLSYRRLCGKVKLEDLKFPYKTVYSWAIALGITKYKRIIRPKFKAAGDYPSPAPTDQELGLDFRRFSETSSSGEEEEESGYEGEWHVNLAANKNSILARSGKGYPVFVRRTRGGVRQRKRVLGNF